MREEAAGGEKRAPGVEAAGERKPLELADGLLKDRTLSAFLDETE